MGRCLREVVFATILPLSLSFDVLTPFGPSNQGSRCSTHILLPANTPADPSPLKARPTTNAVEFGADAATTDPITKTKNDAI